MQNGFKQLWRTQNKTPKRKWRGKPLTAAHSAQDGIQSQNRQRALTNQQGNDSDAMEKWMKAGTGITQEETQMTNKYLPSVSSSAMQSEMQKGTGRYRLHLRPAR